MKEQYPTPESSRMRIPKRGILGIAALAGVALASGFRGENVSAEEIQAKLKSNFKDTFVDDSVDVEPRRGKIKPAIESQEFDTYSSEAMVEESIFDNNPDFFKTITEDGDFSAVERARRTKEIAPGIIIFEDVGVTFYQVQEGDTLQGIKKKLGALPQYEHILKQRRIPQSFNIPPEEIAPGMLLPIPMRNIDRNLSIEKFASYAARGILEMKDDPRYGPFVHELLQKMSEEELLATCIAIAKQESGGSLIGQFEYHAWETNKKVFSLSIYHIMMKDAGLTARKNINVSEGQMYHPQIATKVLLAFLKEKGESVDNIFPIDQNPEAFAEFYNGSKWREINPHYAENIRRYYEDAFETLNRIAEHEQSPTIRLVSGGRSDIVNAEEMTNSVRYVSDKVVEDETPAKKESMKVVSSVVPERVPDVARTEVARNPGSGVSVERRGQVDWSVVGADGFKSAIREIASQRIFKHNVSTELLERASQQLSDKVHARFGKSTVPEGKIGIGEDINGAYVIYQSDPNDHSSRVIVRLT